MPRQLTNLNAVRHELRMMTRGNLLIIAERATEILSTGKLNTLLADFMPLNKAEERSSTSASLFDDVRKFHAASLGGEYYEEIRGRSHSGCDRSRGTDTFIAEFDRLTRQCIRAAKTAPPLAIREVFELLFDVLRHIDKGNDDIIFFADEGGSRDIGVDWHAVFPVYFRCLAKTASAHVFAQGVEQAIRDFADDQRTRHLQSAHRVANPAQTAALRSLLEVSRR